MTVMSSEPNSKKRQVLITPELRTSARPDGTCVCQKSRRAQSESCEFCGRGEMPTVTYVIGHKKNPVIEDNKSIDGPIPASEFRIFEVFPLLKEEREDVSPQNAYILYAIRNPDPGSDLDVKTAWFRNWLPDCVLLFVIQMMGYNGYLMYRGHQIVGHMFYQERGIFWYSFSLFVSEKHRGKGFSKILMGCVLEHAFHSKKIMGLRMGKGTHPIVARIRHEIVMNRTGLSFKVCSSADEPGWIKFVRMKPKLQKN